MQFPAPHGQILLEYLSILARPPEMGSGPPKGAAAAF